MRYLGGKHFQARAYVGHLINEIGTVYVEPFTGGFNTAIELVRQRSPFKEHIYNDLMVDTVELHRAVMDGYEPQPVSRERFAELKAGPRNTLEAHVVGLLQTFCGKRWDSYVPTDTLSSDGQRLQFNGACNGLKRSAGALRALQGLSLAVGPYVDVSEYTVPGDWEVIYSQDRLASAATNSATAPRLELLVRKSPIPSSTKRVLSSSGLTAGAGQLALFS